MYSIPNAIAFLIRLLWESIEVLLNYIEFLLELHFLLNCYWNLLGSFWNCLYGRITIEIYCIPIEFYRIHLGITSCIEVLLQYIISHRSQFDSYWNCISDWIAIGIYCVSIGIYWIHIVFYFVLDSLAGSIGFLLESSGLLLELKLLSNCYWDLMDS